MTLTDLLLELLFYCKGLSLLKRLAEIELNNLQKWIKLNRLTINFDTKK